MGEAKDRGAVLQFEIDRGRWAETKGTTFSGNFASETPMDRLYAMAKSAACDTIFRGGTFVLVVSATKITMIQRPEAEDI